MVYSVGYKKGSKIIFVKTAYVVYMTNIKKG